MLEKIRQSLEVINEELGIKEQPKALIVLGSGLGPFVDNISHVKKLPYKNIPHFKSCSVEGHSGALHYGKINESPVLIMEGRLHYYEGHSLEEIVYPLRTLKQTGIEQVILTNAAGGINQKFQKGQLVLIKDHLNLTGRNPLIGPNREEVGPRFPDMTNVYCNDWISKAEDVAKGLKIKVDKGVYAGVLGPSYETPAEIKMLATLGADLVGMSTVFESITAHHMGIKVGALSCVTNMAAGISPTKLDHHEIKDVAKMVLNDFSKLMHQLF